MSGWQICVGFHSQYQVGEARMDRHQPSRVGLFDVGLLDVVGLSDLMLMGLLDFVDFSDLVAHHQTQANGWKDSSCQTCRRRDDRLLTQHWKKVDCIA